MNQKTRTISLLAASIAVLAIAVVLAGCGSTTPAEAPSTIYPESSPTSGPAVLKAYLNDAKVVLTDLSATAASVPDAVAGMNKKPDSTWTTAATNLQDISTQLGDEATALAALQPPESLQPVQDVVVKGIEARADRRGQARRRPGEGREHRRDQAGADPVDHRQRQVADPEHERHAQQRPRRPLTSPGGREAAGAGTARCGVSSEA